MRPKVTFLEQSLIERVLDEAFQLLIKPGIKVSSEEARTLLADAGADVNLETHVVAIPEEIARQAMATVPSEFFLYDRNGNPAVQYGGDAVHFDPGSSGVNIFDSETLQHRPAVSADLVNVIKIAEQLPQYDAQSTALVCSEIPVEIGDLYRLYLVLLHSVKPIVTGAFSVETTDLMVEMLSIFAGGRQELKEKPLAVFDVCPSPPLIWSDFGAQNLIDLARAGVPAEIVSMPLSGAAAPITLIGSVVQHAVECAPCLKPACATDYRCLLSIRPEEVWEAALACVDDIGLALVESEEEHGRIRARSGWTSEARSCSSPPPSGVGALPRRLLPMLPATPKSRPRPPASISS